MMLATLLARVRPASTSAKPACMKMTSTAASSTKTLSRLTWTSSASISCAPAGAGEHDDGSRGHAGPDEELAPPRGPRGGCGWCMHGDGCLLVWVPGPGDGRTSSGCRARVRRDLRVRAGAQCTGPSCRPGRPRPPRARLTAADQARSGLDTPGRPTGHRTRSQGTGAEAAAAARSRQARAVARGAAGAREQEGLRPRVVARSDDRRQAGGQEHRCHHQGRQRHEVAHDVDRRGGHPGRGLPWLAPDTIAPLSAGLMLTWVPSSGRSRRPATRPRNRQRPTRAILRIARPPPRPGDTDPSGIATDPTLAVQRTSGPFHPDASSVTADAQEPDASLSFPRSPVNAL